PPPPPPPVPEGCLAFALPVQTFNSPVSTELAVGTIGKLEVNFDASYTEDINTILYLSSINAGYDLRAARLYVGPGGSYTPSSAYTTTWTGVSFGEEFTYLLTGSQALDLVADVLMCEVGVPYNPE
ncbi:MAG: hypothetical protein Q7L07_19160, partial [Pseudohongiella sp.]|nr:hypothetical protein [Pseudohongiella sp.]